MNEAVTAGSLDFLSLAEPPLGSGEIDVVSTVVKLAEKFDNDSCRS